MFWCSAAFLPFLLFSLRVGDVVCIQSGLSLVKPLEKCPQAELEGCLPGDSISSQVEVED